MVRPVRDPAGGGLARRSQWAHIQSLRAGIDPVRHRLSLPLGEKGPKGLPGGYKTRQEWFAKTRRLATLEARITRVETDLAAGRVSVVRGVKRLLHKRHHLRAAGLSESEWRADWDAARWFLSADGETGKRFGNETIRLTPDGELSLRLPVPLSHLANAPHARYVLTSRAVFAHRGEEWTDRVAANRAVAYRIHHNPANGRWKPDASWQRAAAPVMPLESLRAGELIGVDMNADHLAVDPSYTSKWAAEHWHKPLAAPHPQTTRHHAASVAIERRALGHRIRRRTAPPDHTRAMWPGIGPSRPDPVPSGVRKPATPAQGHPPDACTRPGRRTRATR